MPTDNTQIKDRLRKAAREVSRAIDLVALDDYTAWDELTSLRARTERLERVFSLRIQEGQP